MATNDKTTAVPPPPAPAVKRPSLSDSQARDAFIAVALREIISWQYAQGKVNELQAAVVSVRIANLVMVERRNTDVLNVVVVKGMKTELGAPLPPEPVTALGADSNEPPKSITEIIGEPAAPLAELK